MLIQFSTLSYGNMTYLSQAMWMYQFPKHFLVLQIDMKINPIGLQNFSNKFKNIKSNKIFE